MDQQHTTASPANAASTPRDLFMLTDEQILEIEPQPEVAGDQRRVASENRPSVISSEARNFSSSDALDESRRPKRDSSVALLPRNDRSQAVSLGTADPVGTEHGSRATDHGAQAGVPVPLEPPHWLAAQMKDPWTGEQARELWNGVQQAHQEAAAYRAAFATPEDAKALKELYPGGVSEARSAAERAKFLDDIDRAYFGAAGSTAEQTSAARAQLAQTLLSEDPAAFREMVFAGLRALEEAETGSASTQTTVNLPRLAQVANRSAAAEAQSFRAPYDPSSAGATLGSPDGGPRDNARSGGASPAPTPSPHQSPVTSLESHLAAYSAFEKAANEDIERSVGAAIARTIEQALPNLKGSSEGTTVGARQGVPLHERLGAAVRQDVEAALKGDRQLAEQVAQILSARRFDNETRAQVVRLIDERARQLVPGAAKRVINDWTQTTLAAHRAKGERAEAAAARREVAPASAEPRGASAAGDSSHAAQARPNSAAHRGATRPDARRIDYRKLSDEQILDL